VEEKLAAAKQPEVGWEEEEHKPQQQQQQQHAAECLGTCTAAQDLRAQLALVRRQLDLAPHAHGHVELTPLLPSNDDASEVEAAAVTWSSGGVWAACGGACVAAQQLRQAVSSPRPALVLSLLLCVCAQRSCSTLV